MLLLILSAQLTHSADGLDHILAETGVDLGVITDSIKDSIEKLSGSVGMVGLQSRFIGAGKGVGATENGVIVRQITDPGNGINLRKYIQLIKYGMS